MSRINKQSRCFLLLRVDHEAPLTFQVRRRKPLELCNKNARLQLGVFFPQHRAFALKAPRLTETY